MNKQTKTCQNCQQNFVIEAEDFAFYERIQVPPPTFCPDCRRQRRASWRNDFYFYSRTCDLCKKPIISLYSPDKPLTVYCVKCWWSDKWDPKDYAQDIDFSRPFFEQFRELQNRVPLITLINDDGIASVNCEYTQDFAFGKNCYIVIVAWRVENCLYSVDATNSKDVADCLRAYDGNELVYEATFCNKCYLSKYIYYSTALTDCSFCFDCRDSADCFLSIGLRYKKYCIKNKQYSKEEYGKIVASYRLDTYSGIERAKKEFFSFIQEFPRKFATHKQCFNVTGDYLINCKNAKNAFNIRGAEDCKYIEDNDSPKDSYDILVGGEYNQCYESLTPDHSYMGLFTIFSWKNSEITYCENCHSSKYLFGCSGLKKAEYCIFNKQYTKEEYESLKSKLIEHMKKTGEWGEFFPSKFSHFGYNETRAQIFYPLEKKEIIDKGLKWQDNFQFTVGRETVKIEDMPDSINDVSDPIVNEILSCVSCSRNYRITPQELDFYRKMKIPLPRQCFYCRHASRIKFRNPYKLYQRGCMCAGEQSDNGIYRNVAYHASHSKNQPCPNEFQTTYTPDRPEIVYCEQCYNAEIS